MVCTTAYGKPILPPLYFLRPYVYIEYEMPATYDCACVYSTVYGIWVLGSKNGCKLYKYSFNRKTVINCGEYVFLYSIMTS